MKKLLNPNGADPAPADPAVTSYDEEHIITYLRLLDADAEGADWRDVSRIALRIDPDTEADRHRESACGDRRLPYVPPLTDEYIQQVVATLSRRSIPII